MNALVVLVALVAAGLVGILGYEALPSATEADPAPIAVSAPSAGNAPIVAAPATMTAANNDVLLKRPLFSQTRRPPDGAGPASATGSAEALPRMTGILIDGPNRRAIFAGGHGGKAVTVVEGGRLGAFTVQSIGPRQVTLVGPAGPQTVRTTFDPSLAAPAQAPASSFISPQFPGIQLPGIVSGSGVLGGAIPSSGIPSGPFNSQPATPGFDAGNGSSPGAAR
ncbi:MAG: hypothetical protein ACRYF2_09445 [Janthinobacterium lividum]